MWTESGEGAPIRLFAAYNEREEAGFVVDRILELHEAGTPSRSSGTWKRRTIAW